MDIRFKMIERHATVRAINHIHEYDSHSQAWLIWQFQLEYWLEVYWVWSYWLSFWLWLLVSASSMWLYAGGEQKSTSVIHNHKVLFLLAILLSWQLFMSTDLPNPNLMKVETTILYQLKVNFYSVRTVMFATRVHALIWNSCIAIDQSYKLLLSISCLL